MFKAWKFFQYAYLIIAVICFIEGFVSLSKNPNKSYMLFGFGIFITLVFIFKRRFRKKIETKTHQNKS